ncbi:hypothetical protein [Fimbriiglobus ruber]|uniref:DUF4351 domain-containing protein n=1 Tax=Fimbriiglobus ruber TaxID=1908690 RepID=A0A225D3F9_9BACT|nr:hypothetical protein [Fimbriiglobus ruber]OWK36042.1 hypothetical protein FRUB_08605 [Fimbriiglobus ruber]
MPHPYDATSKDLLDADPARWVTYLTREPPPGPVDVIDADLSTVTAEADKVIRVNGSDPWLLHLEFQANTDRWLVPRVLKYNAMLYEKHELAVASVVVLMRPAANMPAVTGSWAVPNPLGSPRVFEYRVIRVWERPPEEFLTGPLALLPLAPIAATDRTGVSAIVDRIRGRLGAEADRPLVAKLWACTSVLMGLRYESAFIDRLLEGVLQMEESTTYQALLARGEARGETKWRLVEARAIISRLGTKRFGPPPATVTAALEATTDLSLLEELGDRLLDARGWDDLFPVA